MPAPYLAIFDYENERAHRDPYIDFLSLDDFKRRMPDIVSRLREVLESEYVRKHPMTDPEDEKSLQAARDAVLLQMNEDNFVSCLKAHMNVIELTGHTLEFSVLDTVPRKTLEQRGEVNLYTENCCVFVSTESERICCGQTWNSLNLRYAQDLFDKTCARLYPEYDTDNPASYTATRREYETAFMSRDSEALTAILERSPYVLYYCRNAFLKEPELKTELEICITERNGKIANLLINAGTPLDHECGEGMLSYAELAVVNKQLEIAQYLVILGNRLGTLGADEHIESVDTALKPMESVTARCVFAAADYDAEGGFASPEANKNGYVILHDRKANRLLALDSSLFQKAPVINQVVEVTSNKAQTQLYWKDALRSRTHGRD